MDRLCLRGVFLVPRRASDRLYAGPAGVPHTGLHRRLPRAGRAGAGDFQGGVTSGVSRTRCRVLPAMRSIVRSAAPQSRDPHFDNYVDPGSAAHRHTASKTLENALMALRSVRGTNLTETAPSAPARWARETRASGSCSGTP